MVTEASGSLGHRVPGTRGSSRSDAWCPVCGLLSAVTGGSIRPDQGDCWGAEMGHTSPPTHKPGPWVHSEAPHFHQRLGPGQLASVPGLGSAEGGAARPPGSLCSLSKLGEEMLRLHQKSKEEIPREEMFVWGRG